MVHFLIRRIISGVLVLAGVVVVIFFLFNVLPADPARMMLGQRADSASIAIINKDLGIDQSLSKQFLMYVNDLSVLSIYNEKNPESRFYLDTKKYPHFLKIFTLSSGKAFILKPPYLRRSYQSKRNVSEILGEKIPDTAVLAFAAIVFATIIGIVLGILSALKRDTVIDRFTLALSVSGVAVPSFFVAIIFAWIFGYLLSQYTGLNMTGGLYSINAFSGEHLELKNLILPMVVLGIRPLSIIVQLTRSSLLDVLSNDYIRTARAKGLGRYAVIAKHALQNALNPVVTAISGWLGSLLAGAVFIEYIFGWNGIGKLTVTSLENYDLPVVMGIVLFISSVFIVLNIISDLMYGLIDPRIRIS